MVAAVTRNFDKQISAVVRPGGQGRRCSPASRSTSLDDLADADIVVEAIAEDLAVKTTLFENLDDICKRGAILATTTSSLPIIATARRRPPRPQDVIGMHFFNPAPVMKLVEVVSTVVTSGTSPRPRGRSARSRQGRRVLWGPCGLHRQRCCSPTSTTR